MASLSSRHPHQRPARAVEAAAYPYQPVKERGTLRSFLLALVMHLLLGIVLYYGVHWQSSTPVGAEAELWEEVPDVAPAPPPPPRPVELPRPTPPEPAVRSKVEEAADIALERQKRKQAEEAAEREAAKQEAARKEQERKDQAKKEQEKKDQEKKEAQRKEDLRQQQIEAQRKEDAKKKADQERKEAADAKAKAEADQKAKAKADADAKAKADAEQKAKAKADADAKAKRDAAANAQRKSELARLQAMAGGGVSSGGGVGSAAGSGAGSGGKASPGYADRVRRRVKPNIIFGGDVEGNPAAVVSVSLAPDGSLLSARLTRSSGNSDWDNAVLRAVQRSDPLPRDEDGKAPANFTITFKPKD
ncbi:cell envelope integrity protein TolA [Cupriavidus metallidurans]|uniref:TolA-related transport transmembrane protein n=1 Tax=Cupriavidus metallidurans (strain ATCC 43123 / DSM 2839 / NBRC 102507 / CH34) TaxID=266264 RepID=Q1LJX7_CUPMC|nr:cell envelope integrity protein TolA [Cupriavidus metallidurans]ABF09549.1 tolA-related transport transmembrane protein [Cupriavidus metallidurans CH34]QGS29596.1 cell envelope integrity protein TolA [Cupriavidus metallidurans]UBM10236.1 cell envelope integrity protein TolA [Cupriavidus metallidurans]